MNLARIKKALVAGAGAAISAIWAALVNGDKPATQEGWAGLIGGAIGLGIAAAVATYFARNAGTVNGSDPKPPTTLLR
jgi:hypothetical protein